MPLLYSSNSPYFLDYLASTYSRSELLANPDLCNLLEDPYIKDNTEIAYKYNDAKTGGYDEKKEFIQYLLCNGPELEAETILYYRDKIKSSPELTTIAKIEFPDMSVLQDIRFNTYNKETSKQNGNCFLDPCNYLGDFSTSMGIMADTKTYSNIANVFELAKMYRLKAESNKNSKSTTTTDNATLVNAEELEQSLLDNPVSSERPGQTACLTDVQKKAKAKRDAYVASLAKESVSGASSSNLAKSTSGTGHSNGGVLSDHFAARDNLTLSLYSMLGDCARIVNYSKQYNYTDPNQNSKVPLSQPLKYKWPSGYRKSVPSKNTDSFAAPPTSLSMTGISVSDNYFIDEEKSMIFAWMPYGSCLYKGSENTMLASTKCNKTDISSTVKTTDITKAADGGNLRICPNVCNKDIWSGIKNAVSYFTVGCSAPAKWIKEYFKHFGFNDENDSVSKMIEEGVIWAKVSFVTSGVNGTNTSNTAIKTASTYLMPVVYSGNLSVEQIDNNNALGIDPAIVISGLIKGSSAVIKEGNTQKENIEPIAKINATNNGFDSSAYAVNLFDPSKCSFVSEFSAKQEFKECRVRFYINSKDQSRLGFDPSTKEAELFSYGDINSTVYALSTEVSSFTGCSDWANALRVMIEFIGVWETDFRASNSAQRGTGWANTGEVQGDGCGPNLGMCQTNRDGRRTLINIYLSMPEANSSFKSQISQFINSNLDKASQIYANATLTDPYAIAAQLRYFLSPQYYYMKNAINYMKSNNAKSPLALLVHLQQVIMSSHGCSGIWAVSDDLSTLINSIQQREKYYNSSAYPVNGKRFNALLTYAQNYKDLSLASGQIVNSNGHPTIDCTTPYAANWKLNPTLFKAELESIGALVVAGLGAGANS